MGRLKRAADWCKRRRLGLPLNAEQVGSDQCGQEAEDREAKDDSVSEFGLWLGRFGFGIGRGLLWPRSSVRPLWLPGLSSAAGFGIGRGCFSSVIVRPL